MFFTSKFEQSLCKILHCLDNRTGYFKSLLSRYSCDVFIF